MVDELGRGTLHLVLGPVGSGKSTYATRLADELGAVRFDLDGWMARLYGDDERPIDRVPWYLERVQRVLGQIQEVATHIAAAGTDVVLELGLIRRQDRRCFYAWVDASAWDLTVHLLDAPREVRRERVRYRNAARGPTFSMPVPDEVFELASDLWEAPDELERSDRRIVDVQTG